MEFNLINPIAERKTKTVYRDGDKTIKLFVENYSKADILNEALIQSRVEENTDLKISARSYKNKREMGFNYRICRGNTTRCFNDRTSGKTKRIFKLFRRNSIRSFIEKSTAIK